jgi:HD superfamily phosphodiesterase
MKLTLDSHVKQDLRILSVYHEARRLHREKGLHHHNFQHVLRDLHRALLIAAEEASVDYGVLIPAVLLHDIGFLDPDFKRLGHDVTGARLAQELLSALGYEEETRQAISHCIRSHKGKAEIPCTTEAKILYDADVLEKAGLAYLILGGKIVCELDETIEDFLRRETRDRASELARGFYTGKAKELAEGRLKRTWSLLSEAMEEIKALRPDYQVTEEDLWEEAPERPSGVHPEQRSLK